MLEAFHVFSCRVCTQSLYYRRILNDLLNINFWVNLCLDFVFTFSAVSSWTHCHRSESLNSLNMHMTFRIYLIASSNFLPTSCAALISIFFIFPCSIPQYLQQLYFVSVHHVHDSSVAFHSKDSFIFKPRVLWLAVNEKRAHAFVPWLFSWCFGIVFFHKIVLQEDFGLIVLLIVLKDNTRLKTGLIEFRLEQSSCFTKFTKSNSGFLEVPSG